MLQHETSYPFERRAAAFLRTYARRIAAGQTWDTPETMSRCLRVIAARLDAP